MESDITESELLYKLWAWGDRYKKQLLAALIVLAIAGIVIAFWLTHQTARQNDANMALSRLTSQQLGPNAPEPAPGDFLKIATDFPNTDAGQRAMLIGASDLFASGKYDEAQAQFQKFLQQYANSPFTAQAALGVAASYDAMGKTNDAVSSYQAVIDRYPAEIAVASQANLALAHLLETQGKFKDARDKYEELAAQVPGTIGSEAGIRLQALNAAHPELQPTNPPVSRVPMINTVKKP
ncbi:MAG TPA: tetratricopeptide repeat protein [Candidatus Angelobacter sp.]|nr:tetratricopeptide repeat protein [Candidatus Angelobacter sp.]